MKLPSDATEATFPLLCADIKEIVDRDRLKFSFDIFLNDGIPGRDTKASLGTRRNPTKRT